MNGELRFLENTKGTATQEPLFKQLEILLCPKGAKGDDGRDVGSIAFHAERCLVSWVLLTRLSQDSLDRAWFQYSTILGSFAKDLLSLPQTTSCRDLYVRLIAQVTSRLSEYPNDLGECLLQSWEDSKPLPVQMDVCTSLDAWMESDPVRTSELRILERIWNSFVTPSNAKEPPSTDNGMAEIATVEAASDVDNNKRTTALEYELMSQTLSAILTENHQTTDYYSTESWNELVLALFQSHGHQLLPNSLIPMILSSPLPPSSARSTQHFSMAWHEWIFSLIQTRVTTTPSFDRTCLKDPKAIHGLNKLLLAHAVALTNDSLRGMAWQTLTAIGENCGWRWILSEEPSPLGAGTALCTWVRLASGELNIQLQQEIRSSTTPTGSAPASSGGFMHASSILPISHSCARVLMSVVQFCVQLEEEPHRMPISSESLLHLRQSLEQALWTLVEYLQYQHDDMEALLNRTDQSFTSLFVTIAIRLFGTLLMEVDIWDLLHKEESPQAILNALINSLPLEKQFNTGYSLLPGLVNIIGDAEANPEKQDQLSLIWPPLFEYLHSYWQDHKHTIDDTIAWACSCTELWSEHHDSSATKKRRLTVLLIDWIQTVLELTAVSAVSPEVQSCLSLVLGCYMTLCKDREQPPRHHESRVIMKALQLCEHP